MIFTKVPTHELSSWRRVAPHMWRRPDYPVAYGFTEIDISEAQRALAELRAQSGLAITINHLAVKATANALTAVPEANCLVMRRAIYRRPTIDVCVMVALEGGRDLVGVTLHEADRMSVPDIARNLARKVSAARAGGAGGAAEAKKTANRTPRFLRRLLTNVADFLIHEGGLNLSRFGLSPNQFGSAAVTFMGSFEGSGPMIGIPPLLMPLARLSAVVAIGRSYPRPVAVGTRVEVRPVLPVGGAFDHRLLDGAQVNRLVSVFRQAIENPWHSMGIADAIAS